MESGETALANTSKIREQNIIRDVEGFVYNSRRHLTNLRTSLFLQQHIHGNQIGNWTENYKRVVTQLAPIITSTRSFSEFFYGNSQKYMFSIEISKYRNRIQSSGPDLLLKSSEFDEYFQLLTNTTTIKEGYDCTTRPWYKPRYIYPQYVWSEIWSHFLFNSPSIAAVTRLDFAMISKNGSKIEIVEEIIGMQYDLFYMDELLNEAVQRHLDVNAKSIEIVLVEQNGMLVSNSFSFSTVSNGTRAHLSQINNMYEKLSEKLEELHLIHPNHSTKFTDLISQILLVNNSLFNYNGRRISATTIQDSGLYWVLLISTEENGYIQFIFSSSPILLSISIVLIVIGTICMIVLTQLVAFSIYKVVNNNIRLSRMEIRKVTFSKISNLIYELSLLQQSTNAIKRELTSFMHYIPKDLVCDIVKTGQFAQLGMVNTHTTVMFTDIANFTTISETTPISILIEVLSSYFSIVSQAVEGNCGIIDKFIGDGTMSLFSTPHRVIRNHAECACKAALVALKEIEKFKEKAKINGWPIVDIRIGINTGDAMIGNIGWEERFNYTAIGDCVNTSSRLESLGKYYQLSILIGQETYEAVKDIFLCFFVDSVRMKGKVTSINVYAIETTWEYATNIKIAIHDKLETIRNLMQSREFLQMNEMIRKLLSELYESNIPRSQIPCNEKKEEGLYSNIQFIVDLLHRSETLISQQDNTLETFLEMKEK